MTPNGCVSLELAKAGTGATMVQAPGVENESGRAVSTISRRKGSIRHDGAPGSVASRASKCAIVGGVGTEASQAPEREYELRDVVEPALARALVLAAEAQRWDVVMRIAAELQARRQARSRTESLAVPSARRRTSSASGEV
ncbi:MAG: hypothetical protein RL685_2652 [Pseudomonadota bacterium]|jgi:hypothetical protein